MVLDIINCVFTPVLDKLEGVYVALAAHKVGLDLVVAQQDVEAREVVEFLGFQTEI